MNEIDKIINTTIENLNNKNKLITPSNYEKEFFSLFNNTNLILEDYVEFEEIIENLNNEEKEILKKEDITSFKELAKLLTNRLKENDVKQFLKHLSYYMTPSLSNTDIEKEIYNVCKEIAKNPNSLVHNDTSRKLRKLTKNRIEKDKNLFLDKTSDVKKLINFLGEYIKKVVHQNNNSIDEIYAIKDEIKELKLSSSSSEDLNILQNKLLDIADKFEKVISTNNENINKKTTDILYEQIEELQVCLSKAEEEKSIDFLTGVLTRRAFDVETAKIEYEYKTFETNYAMVFYDIDFFKKINDTYGHACGDFILKTFASILKELTRNGDILVRYGGEEFVAMIHYKNKSEIVNYIKRVKNIIVSNNFVYNDIKLKVEFCAGVTFRNKYNSFSDALIKSDELLYEAKHSGRNKIIFDSGEVL